MASLPVPVSGPLRLVGSSSAGEPAEPAGLSLINGEALWIVGRGSRVCPDHGGDHFVTRSLRMRAPGRPVPDADLCWNGASPPRSFQLIGWPPSPVAALMLFVWTWWWAPRFTGGGAAVIRCSITLLLVLFHPAVYVITCRCSGCSPVCFRSIARKPSLGYRFVADGLVGDLGALEPWVVWVHHMSTSGVPQWMRGSVHGPNHAESPAQPAITGVRLARTNLGRQVKRLNRRCCLPSAACSTSWLPASPASCWPRCRWTSM